MFTSLRSRLIASYVIIIVLCLLLAGLILVVMVRPLQIRFTQALLADRVGPAATRVREIVNRGVPVAQVAARLQELGMVQNVRVIILDTRGNVVSDSEGQWGGQSLADTMGRDMRRESPNPLRGRVSGPDDKTWLYAAAPTGPLRSTDGGERRLLVALLSPLRGMETFFNELMVGFIWAGLLAFLVSIVIALLIARSIARPLQRITVATEEMARGNYDQELDIRSPDEVRRLAASFNTMAHQVKASRQAQHDFVANVSHDLKTPLTSIQGFSQAILDGAARDEAARHRAAQIIHDEAERMSRLVSDLLDLAKIEAGQVVMARQPVNLGLLLRQCVEKQALRVQQNEVTLQTDLAAAPVIQGDGDRLAQVFTNLIDNALKHVSQGGQVGVVVKPAMGRFDQQRGKPQSLVEVAITDNGPGIPPEDLSRIFERFYQVDKSRTRGKGGAGLGLSIVKEIVSAHGGSIKAESVVGVGTKFTVTLPVDSVDIGREEQLGGK